jgi:hypothetical protein
MFLGITEKCISKNISLLERRDRRISYDPQSRDIEKHTSLYSSGIEEHNRAYVSQGNEKYKPLMFLREEYIYIYFKKYLFCVPHRRESLQNRHTKL